MNSLLKLSAAFPLWAKYSNSATFHAPCLPLFLISISIFQFNMLLFKLVEPIQVPVFPRGSLSFLKHEDLHMPALFLNLQGNFWTWIIFHLELGRTLGIGFDVNHLWPVIFLWQFLEWKLLFNSIGISFQW